MTCWDFAAAHPVWALVYLWLVVACFVCLRGFVQVRIDQSKHGYNVDCSPLPPTGKQAP